MEGRMDYYDPKDLKRFSEMGKFSQELMKKFFDYYNAATGEDGALTKREKALIALAVAHVKKCPYCIDAYTTQCLETGADPEQMTEAIHVAASMEAGITLIHGIQMHNALEKNGRIVILGMNRFRLRDSALAKIVQEHRMSQAHALKRKME